VLNRTPNLTPRMRTQIRETVDLYLSDHRKSCDNEDRLLFEYLVEVSARIKKKITAPKSSSSGFKLDRWQFNRRALLRFSLVVWKREKERERERERERARERERERNDERERTN